MRQTFHYTSGEIVKTGVTFGSAMAMAISFNINQSVFWTFILDLCGLVHFDLLGEPDHEKTL